MQFLNRLFGGKAGNTNNSASKQTGDDAGLYYYVQDNATNEVMRIRVNRNNDLSADDDDNGGFFVRKMLTGSRGYNRVEVKLSYDSRRNFTGAEVEGGKMVDEDAYQTYLARTTTP